MICSRKAGRLAKQVATYATASAARSESGPTSDVHVQRLPNGVTVASVQRQWPVAKVSLLFRAGSRHEDDATRGMTHLIRRSVGLSNSHSTGLGLTRSLVQMGAGLQCASTREHLIYTLDISGDLVGEGFQFLADTATRPLFYHWELGDSTYKYMKQDVEHLHSVDQTALLFDRLHDAAFTRTLGRSLYAPLHKIGDISYEQIEEFMARHFVPSRTTLVGVGVPHDQLVEMVHSLNLHEAKEAVTDEVARFRGGEHRIETGSPITQVALVSAGAPLSNTAGTLAHAVLAHALGHGAPHVQWGGPGSPLGQAVERACTEPAMASAINLSYSDAGAFGIYVAAHGSEAGAAVKAAREVVLGAAKAGVKPEDVQRAKQQLKMALLSDADSVSGVVEDLGVQASLFGEKAATSAAVAAMVDGVTAEQVNQAAKKLITGKFAIAAVGDLDKVPHLNDLV